MPEDKKNEGMDKYGVQYSEEVKEKIAEAMKEAKCPDCRAQLSQVAPPHCPNCGTKPFEKKGFSGGISVSSKVKDG